MIKIIVIYLEQRELLKETIKSTTKKMNKVRKTSSINLSIASPPEKPLQKKTPFQAAVAFILKHSSLIEVSSKVKDIISNKKWFCKSTTNQKTLTDLQDIQTPLIPQPIQITLPKEHKEIQTNKILEPRIPEPTIYTPHQETPKCSKPQDTNKLSPLNPAKLSLKRRPSIRVNQMPSSQRMHKGQIETQTHAYSQSSTDTPTNILKRSHTTSIKKQRFQRSNTLAPTQISNNIGSLINKTPRQRSRQNTPSSKEGSTKSLSILSKISASPSPLKPKLNQNSDSSPSACALEKDVELTPLKSANKNEPEGESYSIGSKVGKSAFVKSVERSLSGSSIEDDPAHFEMQRMRALSEKKNNLRESPAITSSLKRDKRQKMRHQTFCSGLSKDRSLESLNSLTNVPMIEESEEEEELKINPKHLQDCVKDFQKREAIENFQKEINVQNCEKLENVNLDEKEKISEKNEEKMEINKGDIEKREKNEEKEENKEALVEIKEKKGEENERKEKRVKKKKSETKEMGIQEDSCGMGDEISVNSSEFEATDPSHNKIKINPSHIDKNKIPKTPPKRKESHLFDDSNHKRNKSTVYSFFF
jgi:hypothetical protein